MSPRYKFWPPIVCISFHGPQGDVEVLRKEWVNFQRLRVRMNNVRIELGTHMNVCNHGLQGWVPKFHSPQNRSSHSSAMASVGRGGPLCPQQGIEGIRVPCRFEPSLPLAARAE